MLNDYWAVVVPAIDAAGGVIEHFAGDGIMAIFNARGDQPDHARRAALAATSIVDGGASRSSRPGRAGRCSGSASIRDRPSSATSARPGDAASRSSATRSTRLRGSWRRRSRVRSSSAARPGKRSARARGGRPRRRPGQGQARCGRGVEARAAVGAAAPTTARISGGVDVLRGLDFRHADLDRVADRVLAPLEPAAVVHRDPLPVLQVRRRTRSRWPASRCRSRTRPTCRE